jgi:hypothetical protein
MKCIVLLVLGSLFTICLGNGLAGDPVSPLFQARLDATKAEWERGGEASNTGGQAPVWAPASANPQSLCTNTICFRSGCIGSACMGSACLGSGCAGSICYGSACEGLSLCPKKCNGNDGAADRADPGYNNLTCTWGPCKGL